MDKYFTAAFGSLGKLQALGMECLDISFDGRSANQIECLWHQAVYHSWDKDLREVLKHVHPGNGNTSKEKYRRNPLRALRNVA